jgi:DNA-binding NarL/FixJ family response regulator
VPPVRSGCYGNVRGGGLTSRQAEILGYVADGLTSREIAGKLVLSTGTTMIDVRLHPIEDV